MKSSNSSASIQNLDEILKDSQQSPINLGQNASSCSATSFSLEDILEGTINSEESGVPKLDISAHTLTTQTIVHNQAMCFKMPGKFWGTHTDKGNIY